MKQLFIFTICLISFSTGYSQIYIGAKVGIAPSLLAVGKNNDYKSGIQAGNVLAGVVLEYPIVMGFSIQPEIQFVQRGGHFKSTRKGRATIDQGNYFSDYSKEYSSVIPNGDGTETETNPKRDNGINDEKENFHLPTLYENVKVKMNYIEGQLLFKYELIGGGTGWYFEIGPYYSMGIGSKGSSTLVDKDKKKKSTESLIDNNGSQVNNFTEAVKTYPNANNFYYFDFEPFKGDRKSNYLPIDYKKKDFGGVVGAGIYKDFDAGRLYFDFRVLWGLTSIGNKKTEPKSRSGQLSITYLFPLGG